MVRLAGELSLKGLLQQLLMSAEYDELLLNPNKSVLTLLTGTGQNKNQIHFKPHKHSEKMPFSLNSA